MQYMLLIYGNEKSWTEVDESEKARIYSDLTKYSQDLGKSGHLLGGNPLRPVATATTLRIRDGKLLTTDGPFAETKEQLGGYFVIEATDLDEALSLAAKMPSLRYGSVEVRPILPREMPPSATR